ncbi:MAG: Lrp/AsnC family transcriptional regulator [Candidatus Micrarchaeota archaeon]|nr:Lrp/AsnC family transcriptional regulator [Candidatus Micrarchaeota archaeon]
MSVDAKGLKILSEIDMSARKPLSEISKRVKLPKQVICYRMKRMEEDEVLRGCRTMVDLHRLGYYTYRLYVRLQGVEPQNEKQVLEKFARFPNVVWFILTTGRWDLEIIFAARNSVHFNRLLSQVKNEVGKYIHEFVISPAVVNYHFGRRYLSGKESVKIALPPYGFEPEIEKLGRKDFEILRFLSARGNASFTDIGKAVRLTYNGAKKRVRALEARGIISGYRAWIEPGKIGRHFYKALVSMEGMDEKAEKRLLGFCSLEPSMLYLVLCSGAWDLEIEAEVENEAEFRKLLARFRNEFRGFVKDYDILHGYEELVLDYFPFSAYEDFSLRIK